MGRGTASKLPARDMEDITPERFRGITQTGALFRLADGRYAVRGELIHSFRHGDVPEGTVLIDPDMVCVALLGPALEAKIQDEAQKG